MLEEHSAILEKDGFVLIKNFFTPEEGNRIISWADQLEKYPEKAGSWMIYFENQNNKSRIENFINFHPQINNFVSSKINTLLDSIVGKKMTIFKDKLNWKRGHSQGFKAHQDQPAWSDFPPKKFISVALFANHATEENGCLEFAKGQHNKGVFNHLVEEKGQLSKDIENNIEWTKVTSTPRDMLIFDSFVPHRSGPNITDFDRRIFYFTFNDSNEGNFYNEYIIKKRIEFPPNIERVSGRIYHGNRYNLANPLI